MMIHVDYVVLRILSEEKFISSLSIHFFFGVLLLPTHIPQVLTKPRRDC